MAKWGLSKSSWQKLRHQFGLSAGVYVCSHTPPAKIAQLAKTLRPVATDTKLIRIGPVADGGYLLPDDLEGIAALFSPGVGPESGFDVAFADRGIPVYMADATVVGPQQPHDLLTFERKNVGAFDDPYTMTMDTWVKRAGLSAQEDLVLQMDIESAEYLVIPTITEALLCRFRIIVVEIHRLHQLWDPFFFRIASTMFEKLLRNHYCVHIHPNNNGGVYKFAGVDIPKAMEFTFIRKDRVNTTGFCSEFPHPLDSHNVDKAPVVLPKIWYGN